MDERVTQERITSLHDGGASKPVFIFPGVYGGPETFRDLGRRLDADRPVFGVHHVGAFQEREPPGSVAELAQLYAADVQRVQPSGPYYLFGYSFGGVVAFEVARALRERGASVGLVMMAECLVPGYPKPAPRWKRVLIHVKSITTGSLEERRAYLAERFDNVKARIAKLVGVTLVEAPEVPMPEHMLRLNVVLFEAFERYRPEPQDVEVLFLTAKTPPDWPGAVFDDPLHGWGPMLRGRVTQHWVPGHHRSLFEPDNVGAIADSMRGALAGRP